MAIFTAIATAVLGAIGLAGASVLGVSLTSLVAGGLALGASVLANKFLSPKASGAAASARTSAENKAVLNQSIGPRVRFYGTCKLGGTRAFWESSNGFLYQIVMHASHRIGTVREIWIGDTAVEIAGGASSGWVVTEPFARGASDGSNSCVYLSIYQGTDTQTAVDDLIANFPDAWTEDHRLLGITYTFAIFKSPGEVDFQKIFPEGYNTAIRIVADGAWCYDPRDEGQSIGDRSTWTPGSDNPSLCILDYLTHADGMRIPWARIDLDSFAAFADICDESVPLKDGGFEPRYRLWGSYSLSEEPKDVLERMTATCDGRLYQTAEGKIAIRGGVWEVPDVTLSDAQILSLRMEQGNGRLSAFNEVRPIYTSPNHDYQEMDGATLRDAALQAVQGKLSNDLPLIMVPSYTQAARLTKIAFARGTPAWKGEVTADISALNALGAQTVALDISEPEIDTTFEISGFSLAADLTGVSLTISSLTAEAYEWDPETEEPDPSAALIDTRPSLVLPTPQDLDLTIQQRTVTGGTTGAVIVATVAAAERDDLTLEAEYRLFPSGSWEAMGVAAGALEAVSGLVGDGQTYGVRARWRAQRVAGPWCAEQTIVAVANPDAPGVPTDLSATAVGDDALVVWTNPATDGFRYTRIYRNTVDTFGTSTQIAQVFGAEGSTGSFLDVEPGTGDFYYWARAYNTSGVASAATASVTITF